MELGWDGLGYESSALHSSRRPWSLPRIAVYPLIKNARTCSALFRRYAWNFASMFPVEPPCAVFPSNYPHAWDREKNRRCIDVSALKYYESFSLIRKNEMGNLYRREMNTLYSLKVLLFFFKCNLPHESDQFRSFIKKKKRYSFYRQILSKTRSIDKNLFNIFHAKMSGFSNQCFRTKEQLSVRKNITDDTRNLKRN